MLTDPTLEHVFTATVQVASVLELGPVPGGRRRIIAITGGTVEGPRLTGVVLPGGADWQLVGDDGVARLTARYTLQAADGTLISVENVGVRHGPPQVIARLAAGEAVDPSTYYFRTSPRFEAPPGPHDWLMRTLFVASGERRRDSVVIRVFAVA